MTSELETRPLCILDLDETLVYASSANQAYDFQCGPYGVLIRPGVDDFLGQISELFRLAVWTSSSASYAECIVGDVFRDHTLEFVWSRSRCTRKFDPSLYDEYYIKDLRKVRRQGYALEQVLMVDNTPRKLQRHYGNLIRVTTWEGCKNDKELNHLASYLLDLRNEPNYRTIEKRGWQRRFG